MEDEDMDWSDEDFNFRESFDKLPKRVHDEDSAAVVITDFFKEYVMTAKNYNKVIQVLGFSGEVLILSDLKENKDMPIAENAFFYVLEYADKGIALYLNGDIALLDVKDPENFIIINKFEKGSKLIRSPDNYQLKIVYNNYYIGINEQEDTVESIHIEDDCNDYKILFYDAELAHIRTESKRTKVRKDLMKILRDSAFNDARALITKIMTDDAIVDKDIAIQELIKLQDRNIEHIQKKRNFNFEL